MPPAGPPDVDARRRRLPALRAVAVSALCLLGLALAAGAAPAAEPSAAQTEEAPWPMVGRDPAHSGSIEGPSPPFATAWTATVDGGPIAGPVVAPNAVVVVGGRSITALDPATGDERWAAEREPGPAGAPGIAGDLVVHASGNESGTELVARRLGDGEVAWRTEVGSRVLGGITVSDRTVYAGTRDARVIAVDAVGGEVRWEFSTGGAVETAPAATGGLVFAASHDPDSGRATLHAIDAEAGPEEGDRWRFSPPAVPSAFPGSPAVHRDLVLLGTSDGLIRGLERETGAERWATRSRHVFAPGQVPAAGEAVVVPDQTHLYRLDPGSGRELWTYRLADLSALPGDRVNTLSASSPAIAGGSVLVGDATGLVSAIDVASGRRVWRERIGPGPVGAVAASADRIYLVSQERRGAVVALEHDPRGTLVDEVSPTVLFPVRALANFALASVIVGAVIVLLFRFGLGGLRALGPGEELPRQPEQGEEPP